MTNINLIANQLDQVRDLFQRELRKDTLLVTHMFDQLNECSGKMLRPSLVLLSGNACGTISQRHFAIAAAVEMIHIATLCHDDVLDEAQLRRYHRTINALHGNEAAVLMGDLLVSRAFGLCSSLDCTMINRRISQTIGTVCQGELMQLQCRGNYQLSEGQYIDIISRKTASLMATCCYLGAYAAGADQRVCQTQEMFGHNLGIAFQIMDDVVDLCGDEQVSGKSLGTDIAQEKLTLPAIHFLRHCSKSQADQLKRVLSRHDRQENELNVLAEKLRQTGSIDYACRQARYYIDQAQNNLTDIEQTEFRNALYNIADQVAGRQPSQIQQI